MNEKDFLKKHLPFLKDTAIISHKQTNIRFKADVKKLIEEVEDAAWRRYTMSTMVGAM